MKPLARLGLVARAVLYALVGLITIQVARGKPGKADNRGALEAVGRRPYGRFLLIAVAAGLAAYAIWRFIEVVRASSLPKRVAAAGKGLIYVGLCASAIKLAAGSGSGDTNETDLTARVMRHRFGRQVVFVAGAWIAIVGIGNLISALTRRWKKHMHTEEMARPTRRLVTAVATIGLLGRAAAFGLVGVFVIRASVRYDAREATGLDGALKRLRGEPHGPLLLVLVAVGLLAYGGYCLAMARYREVRRE